jgi:hypothetical protein
MKHRNLIVHVMLWTVFGMVVSGCSEQPSTLPRETAALITIDEVDTAVVVGIGGCPTYWLTVRGQEPPPGACETTVINHIYTATSDRNRHTVSAAVPETYRHNPLYPLDLVTSVTGDTLTIAVVSPPPAAYSIWAVNDHGYLLDSVIVATDLVAVATTEADIIIQAKDKNGNLLGECPYNGVVSDGTTYRCTPDVSYLDTIPTTTIPTTTDP